jgi:hypothetical protein
MKHTVEQRNLLWGTEVSTRVASSGRRPARVIHVDDQHVGFATALALVVEHGRRACSPSTQTRCPRCGRCGPTERDFGTRVLNGKRRPQSWCRSCRAAQAESTRPERKSEAALPFTLTPTE